MNRFFFTVVFTFLLIIIGISPLPSIPLVMLNYQINGLIAGYIATFIAGTITSSIYFYFANYYIRIILKKHFKKKYKLLRKYSSLISKMSYIEFILLLLSGIIPNSLISLSSGLAKMKFKKFLICYLIVGIPQQFIYLIAASQINALNNVFSKIGMNNINSFVFSLSIVTLLAFVMIYLSRYLNKKLPKIKLNLRFKN